MRIAPLIKRLGLGIFLSLILGFRLGDVRSSPAPTEPLLDAVPLPERPGEILSSSKGSVYLRLQDKTWKRMFLLPRDSGEDVQMAIHPSLPHKLFLATSHAVLEGDLRTRRLRPLLRISDPSANRIHALSLHPKDAKWIFVGTQKGLFQSGDGGITWLGPLRWPENEPVQLVTVLGGNPPLLFIATERELFFSKNGGLTYKSALSLPRRFEELFENNDPEAFEEEPRRRFSSLAFSQDRSQIWIATLEGVYESTDQGLSWQKLPGSGLDDPVIHRLLYANQTGQLIGISSREIARFHPVKRRWESVSVGLSREPTAAVLVREPTGTERIVAFAGNNVSEFALEPLEVSSLPDPAALSPQRIKLFQRLVSREPTVRELQKAAISYGHLGSGRITRWHWTSRLRALIPQVNLGRDFSVDANIDIDRGSTNDPDRFIRGPEEIDRGQDLDLTWELGDLLFNSSQTSIDSRAKLLTEFRHEVLSQINRLYFERRRTQMEIVLTGPGAPLQEYLDRLLRLDELTAELDALTDGFLSLRLTEIYRTNPELESLWGPPSTE